MANEDLIKRAREALEAKCASGETIEEESQIVTATLFGDWDPVFAKFYISAPTLIRELLEALEAKQKKLDSIAKLEGLTLLGEYANTDKDIDRQHQMGAAKAFNQAAALAKEDKE